MNKVALVGRLTKDPQVSRNGDSINARFSVAVNRRFKNKDGNYEADFINCVCFGATAEFIEKFFRKGMAIGVTGSIQTGSYTNREGQKVYTTDVFVNEAEFVESKSATQTQTAPPQMQNQAPPQMNAQYGAPPVPQQTVPPQYQQAPQPQYQTQYQQPTQAGQPDFMQIPPNMNELPFN